MSAVALSLPAVSQSNPSNGAKADVGRWVGSLLQMTDTFYPTGAYAHSFGLEGLAQENVVRDRATLRTFLLEQVLPQLAHTDLPVAAQAWAAAGKPTDWKRLREMCFLGSAMRGAREPREASEAIGRQRLELAALLHGGLAAKFNQRALAGSWPRLSCVAAAIEGRTLGAPCEAVLAAIIYSTTAGLIAASVKLLRLGQNACQTLLAEALAQTPALIAEALAVGPNDIGAFNPWWDVAAARHETADFRLFIS
ncbi:MAG TPA: urease accessory UreF family protein [Opitutaceae bacterium]|nr:urease accessory UreF family protein [Opitutaceae bacterium]